MTAWAYGERGEGTQEVLTSLLGGTRHDESLNRVTRSVLYEVLFRPFFVLSYVDDVLAAASAVVVRAKQLSHASNGPCLKVSLCVSADSRVSTRDCIHILYGVYRTNFSRVVSACELRAPP